MVIAMKTILKREENEIIINNSRFICYLIPLQNPSIDNELREIENLHPKATHRCYAYIYDDIEHSNDDNEPSNTAGQPILNVLKKEELNHVLAVVVRYFGGIKLGAGGLIRAYTKATTECLKKEEIIEMEKGYLIELNFPYEEEKNILYHLQNSSIKEKSYQETISYKVEVNEETLNKIQKYNPTIISEIYIKKNQLN